MSSGFFTGLTAGRVALAEITDRLGERRMIFVYIALSMAMQLMFWFIPDIVANAVVASFLGHISPSSPSILYFPLRKTCSTSLIVFSQQASSSVPSTPSDSPS